ncbi:hypothetical protein Tco_1559448 [Tanacetum coccineum]
MVIKELKYGIFFIDKFGDRAFQRWSDIDKVGMKALILYLAAASMVQSPENARFSMKLKKLIAEHPNQEKFKSNKVKLEALGYKMDWVLVIILRKLSITQYEKKLHSVSCLQDAQPESTRKTLAFNEAVLSE